jgi:hypothetical protein
MDCMDAMAFMKRFPRRELRKTPQGMRPGARREAPTVPSSLYPDCEEAVARFQPSAPESDRVC